MREITDDWDGFKEKVLVVGVGGAGTKAVNHMMNEEMEAVTFVCVNMDKKYEYEGECKVSACIKIGEHMTDRFGTSARPEIGEKAAEESRDEIEHMMKGFDMVFIFGMGGGTGTGAAPVIARIAKMMGILTVAIVTKPFNFEGEKRMKNALGGIEKLADQVDALTLILNDKLLETGGKDAFKSGMFCMVDVVFRQMIQGITELFARPALINLDFADVVTVMKEKGNAYVGSGTGTGKYKLQDAICKALTNPLIEASINGASYVMLNVVGDIGFLEAHEVFCDVQERVGDEAAIIFGIRIDQECLDTVNITVIATGMEMRKNKTLFNPPADRGETGEEIKIASFLREKFEGRNE